MKTECYSSLSPSIFGTKNRTRAEWIKDKQNNVFIWCPSPWLNTPLKVTIGLCQSRAVHTK